MTSPCLPPVSFTTATAEGRAGREAAVYRLHGLRLRSAAPLSGSSSPGDAFDVDLRWAPVRPAPVVPPPGRVVVERADDGRRRCVAVETAGGPTLRVPGVCDFVVERDLAVVERRPDPAADPRLVAVLVSGLVVAFLVSLAGRCVLHASAVAVRRGSHRYRRPIGGGQVHPRRHPVRRKRLCSPTTSCAYRWGRPSPAWGERPSCGQLGDLHRGPDLRPVPARGGDVQHRQALRDSLDSGPATTTFTYDTRPLVPIMGDWDGDGRTAGTFEAGTFRLNNVNDAGPVDISFAFGDRRGFPVVGDYDGKGTDDVAVYRAGSWQVRH